MKATVSRLAIALIFVSTSAQAVWVEVEGQGSTVEEAKQNCFRSAVRNVVGELIVSDTEVSGDSVTKDFIGNYSAGYVNDYEIQQTYYDNSGVTLHMQVDVASSKIAERMRTNSQHITTFSGEKLQTKVSTVLEQRAKGDRVLSTVLSSYPHNAYIINSGQTEAIIGNRRQVYIDMPYEIRWSKYWLSAFLESLNQVSLSSKSCTKLPIQKAEQLGLTLSVIKFMQEKSCGHEADVSVTYKNADEWMLKKQNFYFPDMSMLDVVHNEVRTPVGQQHVGLVVELKDADGSVIDTRCARIATDPLIEYAAPNDEVINLSEYDKHLHMRINGHSSIAGTLRIHAKNVNLVDVHRVDMHLEKTCS